MKVRAILCSDMHLSHTAPVGRSAEPNWYDAQARMLDQLRALQEEHDVPIICAGDVFDRWNPPPSLINFAIRYMPPMWSIPGQHDLPNHRYDLVHNSAYWTLVESHVLRNLYGAVPLTPGLEIIARPWECKWDEPPPEKDIRRLLVTHSYIHKKAHGYHGAPEDQKVSGYADRLKPYDVAHFGDNHSPFQAKCNGCQVVNTGTMMQRKRDERAYAVGVNLLLYDEQLDDISIQRHYFDTSEDVWVEEVEALPVKGHQIDLLDLEAGETLDYRQAVKGAIETGDLRAPVVDLLRSSIDGPA